MSLSYVKDWSILCNIYAMIVSLRVVSSNVCALFFPLLGACWGQLTNGGSMGGLQSPARTMLCCCFCWFILSFVLTRKDKYRFSLRLVALPFEPRSQDRSLGFPFFFFSLESMLQCTLKLKPTLPLCICVTMKSASSEREVICKQPLSKPVPIVFVLKGYDLNSSLMEPMFPLGAFELLDIDWALHTPHTELKHSSSNYSQEWAWIDPG